MLSVQQETYLEKKCMNEIIVIGKDTIATVIKGAPIAVMISLIALLFVYYSSKKRITKIDLSNVY